MGFLGFSFVCDWIRGQEEGEFMVFISPFCFLVAVLEECSSLRGVSVCVCVVQVITPAPCSVRPKGGNDSIGPFCLARHRTLEDHLLFSLSLVQTFVNSPCIKSSAIPFGYAVCFQHGF